MKAMWIVTAGLIVSGQAIAANAPEDNAIAYYKQAEVLNGLRESRQVGIHDITEMLKDKKTVLLDTRSDEDFRRLHIRGAKHLSYADFTTDKLTKLLPDKNTRVIVYCDRAIMNPLTRMMALSTNAFVDLKMQGYDNVYEMRGAGGKLPFQERCRELMDIPFEGDATAITALKRDALSCLSH